jgi:putative methyltransferase (TIGR04325 family)
MTRAMARILPPIAVDALRALRRRWRNREGSELERVSGWPDAADETEGWNHESIAATQLGSWPGFLELVEAPNVLAPVSMDDGFPAPEAYAVHNTRMVFGYVLGRAAFGRDELSFLDWGGGLGDYAVLARAMLPALVIDYHCRELPLLARTGRGVVPDGTFHESDEPALARRYDLVLASGSLQYSRDWRAALAGLAHAATGYLYITRIPIVQRAESFVAVQRPRRLGYTTEYPGWILNRHELLEATEGLALRLEREFLIWERTHIERAPEQPDYRGFLFTPMTQSLTPGR